MPKTAIDYSKTIIYKLVCNDLNVTDIYIGHTTEFTQRKRQHKSNCNNSDIYMYNYKVYQLIRLNGGWDNWSMIEVEKYSCNDKNEATSRERYWYELLNANMNATNPNRNQKERDNMRKEDKKEWYKNNKDKKLEQSKKRYEQNKDQINEYRKIKYQQNKEQISKKGKEKITCECGCIIRIDGKKNHLKSIKHQSYIVSKNLITIKDNKINMLV